MIRSFLAYLLAAIATFFLGSIVIVAAALRHRGPLYSVISRTWGRTLLAVSGSRARVHGIDRVDWSQPHVLVTNHTGSFEILALAANIPVPYHFVAKRELERVPVFGPAWKRAGHISIDRSNRQKAIESLHLAAEIIRRDGGIVIIFPEGTRSRTGELQPFKKGAFLLALEAGVPIIPTIVTGSDRILPPGQLRITPGVMDLYIGDPIAVDGYGPETIDELVASVHRTMSEMLDSAKLAGVS